MLYFIERRVENTFVYKKNGKYFRVEETLKFDFSENVYKLTDLTFEELGQLKGGEKNG
ncbi:MAG: hypothetical protein ACOC5T_08120 [Elusimicrobiota bacterium]